MRVDGENASTPSQNCAWVERTRLPPPLEPAQTSISHGFELFRPQLCGGENGWSRKISGDFLNAVLQQRHGISQLNMLDIISRLAEGPTAGFAPYGRFARCGANGGND